MLKICDIPNDLLNEFFTKFNNTRTYQINEVPNSNKLNEFF